MQESNWKMKEWTKFATTTLSFISGVALLILGSAWEDSTLMIAGAALAVPGGVATIRNIPGSGKK